MIRRKSITAPKRASAKATVRARKNAQVRRFWLDLNARLIQARKHGVTLQEATRRLEERESGDGAVKRAAERRTRLPSR
jgi:hypothetical protein